mmetsp:Transcript_1789/g.2464  ORF Transcript_1789/g.2464 Transcript_1789/m.2464 type:complete len:99 (+) Transcript_1789:232-528(+)
MKEEDCGGRNPNDRHPDACRVLQLKSDDLLWIHSHITSRRRTEKADQEPTNLATLRKVALSHSWNFTNSCPMRRPNSVPTLFPSNEIHKFPMVMSRVD